jgi:formate dehydrogenase subunit delta
MIHSANEIALHFQSFPREEAIEGIRDHIEKLWEPRLRAQLIDYVARGGEDLQELVVEAVKRMAVDA